MGVRYIGSKARVVGDLMAFIGSPGTGDGFFVDAFCGTGVVAEAAADAGWPIRLNDHLVSAALVAEARLLSHVDTPFAAFGDYFSAITKLNSVTGRHGFIHRQYSPASLAHSGVERRYFTEHNAAKIDGVRETINEWVLAGRVDAMEERLLIADLISATNRVANIAGTYGCFLSSWSPQALASLKMEPRRLRSTPVPREVFVVDVSNTPTGPEDLVYLDPPYTKRQYAAYYHILETIAIGDEPVVGGVTGLRPWREKSSSFCYRRRALNALTNLISGFPACHFLLSYSSEGHVSLGDLEEGLSALGSVEVHSLRPIGRYRPNRVARDAADVVGEYVIEIRKECAPCTVIREEMPA